MMTARRIIFEGIEEGACTLCANEITRQVQFFDWQPKVREEVRSARVRVRVRVHQARMTMGLRANEDDMKVRLIEGAGLDSCNASASALATRSPKPYPR